VGDDVAQTSARLQHGEKLLYKELNHIQAILGRYDTFFFLMKQLCATAVFLSIAEHLKHPEYFSSTRNHSHLPFWKVVFIPGFFLVTEYFFRLFHWSGYIARLGTLRTSLNKGELPQCIYVIKEDINFRKPRWCKRLREHVSTSFKAFDWLVFYPILIMAVLLIQGGGAVCIVPVYWGVAIIVALVAHCLRRSCVEVAP
jgi:hypothetical protein